jgi:hypothetical protein
LQRHATQTRAVCFWSVCCTAGCVAVLAAIRAAVLAIVRGAITREFFVRSKHALTYAVLTARQKQHRAPHGARSSASTSIAAKSTVIIRDLPRRADHAHDEVTQAARRWETRRAAAHLSVAWPSPMGRTDDCESNAAVFNGHMAGPYL